MRKSPSSDTTRVTISLPASLVRELDEQLVRDGASRADAIRRLIEAALREVEAREQRKMHDAAEREEYIRVWREQPLTEEDFGWTTSPEALAHLREIPWDSGAAPCGGQISHTPGDGDPSS